MITNQTTYAHIEHNIDTDMQISKLTIQRTTNTRQTETQEETRKHTLNTQIEKTKTYTYNTTIQ